MSKTALHVGRRARDRPEDLGGRRLLRPCLRELAIPLLQLLDDDRRLGGERLETAEPAPLEKGRAFPRRATITPTGSAIPEHWRGDQAARPDRDAVEDRAALDRAAHERAPSCRWIPRPRWPVPGDQPELIAVLPVDEGFGGPGQTGRGLGEGGEHRLPVAGGTPMWRPLSVPETGRLETIGRSDEGQAPAHQTAHGRRDAEDGTGVLFKSIVTSRASRSRGCEGRAPETVSAILAAPNRILRIRPPCEPEAGARAPLLAAETQGSPPDLLAGGGTLAGHGVKMR